MKRETVGEMLRSSRYRAEISQAEIADVLGVTKKTVQNWEAGLSCPPVDKFIEWFKAVREQPIPFMLRALHEGVGNVSNHASDHEVDLVLHATVQELDVCDKRKLLYCLMMAHGSSTSGVIDMITAHLHAPLRDRINVAMMICANYKMAKRMGTLIFPESTQPDIDWLEKCINRATNAAVDGNAEYTDLEDI